jgi:shikimate dehydrogenase
MTRKAAVLGWPIGHSRSPLIHGTWIAEHGLDASYDPIAVDPATADDWFARFADHGLVGANVTIPHKETAFKACCHISAQAERLGAVNTLWLEGNDLHGTSTDGEGFMANLTAGAPNWRHHPKANTALVLGAGGAARAIIDALLDEDVERILLLNRTVERAEKLATRFNTAFGAGRVQAAALSDFARHASATGLLVNTTAAGMSGQPDLDLPLDALADGASVTDIVYTPLETTLLANARTRGHPVVDGLGMLLHQAVPGFERWFSVRPLVTEKLRQTVLDDIQAQSATRR